MAVDAEDVIGLKSLDTTSFHADSLLDEADLLSSGLACSSSASPVNGGNSPICIIKTAT
jgi:hypothetical protein